ncbi:MAG: S9 family peptidase [Opitutales bacterium]|nr:S9 family peptidase [Opitutales bacterium]
MARILTLLLLGALIYPCIPSVAGVPERREAGNVILEGIPEIPAHHEERIRPYLETRGAGVVDWRPDGEGLLIVTRFGEMPQVHEVRMAGGARHQITFSPENITSVRVRPHSAPGDFLFLRDRGGDELYRLYLFGRESGVATLLSDDASRATAPLWNNAGSRIAYSSTERTGRDWDIHLVDPEDPDNRRIVYEADGFFIPVEFSPDDNRLLLAQFFSATESYLHLLDPESGEIRPVDDDAPEINETIAYGRTAWAHDGKSLFIVSDRDDEFMRLRHHDIESGAEQILTKHIHWNIESIALSPVGDILAFSANEDGISRLYLLDTKTMKIRPPADIPVGIVSGLSWHPDGNRIAFALETPRSPNDAYVIDTESGELEQWTFSEVGGLDTGRFVVPELIRFNTFDVVDGRPRELSAWMFRPETEGPHPVVVFIHGGPAAQYRPRFSPLWQYITNEMGAAVIAPNVRGSTGYGRTFVSLDDGYLREDSVRDIGALLDWIGEQEDPDADRVITMGGSYGGYMVYASHIHYGERLAGGISTVGISNFVTFLENTADYRRDLRRVEYGDERDPEMRTFLESISPLNHADRIHRPMLIAQGANDPRVPLSEAEQMVERIRASGIEPWYFLALDEGHGFRRKSNADLYRLVTVAFIEKVFGPDRGGAERSR